MLFQDLYLEESRFCLCRPFAVLGLEVLVLINPSIRQTVIAALQRIKHGIEPRSSILNDRFQLMLGSLDVVSQQIQRMRWRCRTGRLSRRVKGGRQTLSVGGELRQENGHFAKHQHSHRPRSEEMVEQSQVGQSLNQRLGHEELVIVHEVQCRHALQRLARGWP